MVSLFAAIVLLWTVSVSNGITNKGVFSTKTAYDWVVNTTATIDEDQGMTITYDGKTCNAIHVNMVGRHGYRNPGDDDMEDFTKIRDALVADMDPSSEYFAFLRDWVNRYDPQMEKMLVPRGREEWLGLGRRMAKRFKSLLRNESDAIELMSSDKERSISSSQAFFAGLTEGLLGSSRTDRNPILSDPIIRFYDDCARYDEEVDDVEYPEVIKFKGSEHIANVKNGIKTLLGLENVTLTNDVIDLLYELCAFEMAMYNDDGFCALMTDAERLVIEYLRDIEDYYEKSYGNDISGKIACVLVNNMFKDMANIIQKDKNGEPYNKGAFKFGHSETLTSLYTALRLVKDNRPLLATNFASMTNRKFRSSIVFPMSANIAFVLYSCPGQGVEQEYVIKLFLNEEPANIPACNSPTCKFDDVTNAYDTAINQCQRNEECRIKPVNGGPSNIHSTPKTLFIIALLLVLSKVFAQK